jgi:hypothetical protein
VIQAGGETLRVEIDRLILFGITSCHSGGKNGLLYVFDKTCFSIYRGMPLLSTTYNFLCNNFLKLTPYVDEITGYHVDFDLLGQELHIYSAIVM